MRLPSSTSSRPSRPTVLLAGAALVVGTATAVAAGGTGAAYSATGSSVTLDPKGSIVVTYRGNGHGHGLSQYGAYGAALAGRSTNQILAQYYPGTSLATIATNSLRVLLGNTGSTTTVIPQSELQVSGISGYLPTQGVARYRLVADNGTHLSLQRAMVGGSTWQTVRTGLPDNTAFGRPHNWTTRLVLDDGTRTDYYGRMRAVRASSTGSRGGVRTVDVVGYDAYAAGVTPREMPASWSAAATRAQAIAARTYAVYEKDNAGGRFYDLCDNTNCQVYGGHAHWSAKGTLLWSDLPAAASSTSNQVLEYRGAPILAQYSASNGGWSTDGGEPYLRAAADPYDPGRSGDPYVNATTVESAATFARAVGLATVTKVTLTRDGHGTWGGRVVSAVISGTSDGKKAATRTLSGYDLQSDFGLGTTWIQLASRK